MRIVIVGQGAIGLLWYHHLFQNTSSSISLVCSNRIKNTPTYTHLTDFDNQTRQLPLLLATTKDLNNAELILVCVKSYHIESALIPLIKYLNVSATIVLCHNGMFDTSNFSSLVQPCYSLLTTHGVKVIKPFQVQHTGLGHNDLGLVSGRSVTEIENSIVSTLTQALPSLLLSKNIKEKQWQKLAVNCVINPLTALNNISNGDVLNDKYISKIDNLLKEIILVAEHEKVIFDFNELKRQVLNVAKSTAINCSSMRSDVLHQRKTEIDYINGYIVKLAKKAEISVPENKKLWQEIKALELQY